MKNVDDLIAGAAELADRGLSRGEIADELNVSRETASWLVEQSAGEARTGAGAGTGTDAEPDPTNGGTGDADADGAAGPDGETDADALRPADVHVDWSAIGRDASRLAGVGAAMADMLAATGGAVDLAVGIEKAGVPLATVVARELDTDLATYAPAKHQWDEGDIADRGGGFSRNFAGIRGRPCYVVDDTVTSGTTMRETIDAIRRQGGRPVACAVLVDKRGASDLDDVPLYSLVDVVRVDPEAGT